jgi:uncharacterized membrane protein
MAGVGLALMAPAFFGLWETTLLAAAGAASIPIVIHLLHRRRFQIVPWAAMRFLLQAQRQNIRRLRLEQLLLLAVRLLLVLLLVAAMASVMPWAEALWAALWPEASGFLALTPGRSHKVLVLDASLSMSAKVEGEKTAFARAQELALEVLQQSQPGDGYCVALLGDTPTWVVGEISYDPSRVAREIRQLRPSHGNGNVPALLNLLAAKLAEAPGRFDRREVYFFTDLQRATWLPAESVPRQKEKSLLQELQRRAQLIFVDVGRDGIRNLAVTHLAIDDPLISSEQLVTIKAMVQNFTLDQNAADQPVPVALFVGRAGSRENPFLLSLVEQQEVRVRPGSAQPVTFTYRFRQPGTYAVQVRLEGDDLEPDNARTLIVTVKDHVPLLLVNGQPAAEPFEQATEYLRLALQPFQEAIPRFAPLRPKVVNLSQFADASESDLSRYDGLFLCDVGQLGSSEVRRLQMHVRRGGGLVITCGEHVAENLESYNRLLYRNGHGLLPARFLGVQRAPADHHFYLNAREEAFRQPPLLAFADADYRLSLRRPPFRQYLRVQPAADAGARTILTFMPEAEPQAKGPLTAPLPVDDPALVEWFPPLPAEEQGEHPPSRAGRHARCRGKVLLFTSTVNMDWTTWPGSPSFGTLMQELTRLALAGRLRPQATPVGGLLEEVFSNTGGDLEGRLFLPGADREPVPVRTQGTGELSFFHWSDTQESGVYRLTVGQDPQEYLFAVNPPVATPDQKGSESDPSRLDAGQLHAAYPDWDFQLVRDLSQVRHQPGQEAEQAVRAPLGPVIARYLLLALLGLLLLESVLAWAFGHYMRVGGVQEPAAGSRFWPALIAVLAGLLFVGLAYVLLDAAFFHSGDFLGFAPDWFRRGVEKSLGLPPAPPGEGTRWRLERMPFLTAAPDSPWLLAGVALAAALLIGVIYRLEGETAAPAYRLLLGGLRLFVVLYALAVLGPQLTLRFERQGWPDIAVLVDDSQSMGETDHYQEPALQEAVQRRADAIRQRLRRQLQEELRQLQEQQANGRPAAEADRLAALQGQLANLQSPTWRPSRLQLAQALLLDADPDWLQVLRRRRQLKVHLYHLDTAGRALRLKAVGDVDLNDLEDSQALAQARQLLEQLQPHATDTRLGTAVRQILDQFRGSSLTALILLTDGVTTRDETLAQVADYAAQKGVPLFLVGLGNDHPLRDLKLHDLQVEDTVFVNDRLVFEARLTGHGYKDLTVPVVLKERLPDGTERELARENVRVDPHGKAVKVRLRHQPRQPGEKVFIVEVLLPAQGPGKAPPPSDLRLERTVFVQQVKGPIRVLLVEGAPRYEYRYLKNLLERQTADRDHKLFEPKVLLCEADPDFVKEDQTALAEFPLNKVELYRYDVVIFGDVDPQSPKLSEQKLRDLADFVREKGGGFLMIAGPNYSPHAYRNTPLADILPIEVTGPSPPDKDWPEGYRPELTPLGRLHPIFRFSPDEGENQSLWQRLAPMYWWSERYRLKPLAEVLAYHPRVKAEDKGYQGYHPLVVQQYVGAGRSMFFGFEETWRWRFREDEVRFNQFWIQTVRYLARSRISRTQLRLDRQTPYRQGEPIKVTVKFPDSGPERGPEGGPPGQPLEVKVIVERTDSAQKDAVDKEVQTLQLHKVEGSWATYEGILTRTRQGKYRFWLSSPDVSRQQPNGQPPSAEALVVLPPGELERLRMNREEMQLAAEVTDGRFYTLETADQLLDDLPAGAPIALNTPGPPWRLWNHSFSFLLVLGLLTAEWFLRKRRHLL